MTYHRGVTNVENLDKSCFSKAESAHVSDVFDILCNMSSAIFKCCKSSCILPGSTHVKNDVLPVCKNGMSCSLEYQLQLASGTTKSTASS